MNRQHSIENHHWRKTPLALAILATLPGVAVAAGPPPNPVGPEFRVNTYTTNFQNISAVAMDAAGDFVVTWMSLGQDGSGYGIYAQRYNAAGVAQGSEFRVNTYITLDQRSPAVAMDAAGDFVVTWTSNGQDGDFYGIYAQRYNAAGVAQGSEFRVNTYTTGAQSTPAVAMDAAGDFVVTWMSMDGSGTGIYAQRYNAAGVAQGTEFRVNTYTTGGQGNPAVAMDAAGDFVVAWQSYGQDGSGYGIYAQRYNAAGAPQESEFRVNTYTTGGQGNPAVAMDAAGDFVITWQGIGQGGSGNDIYAQRYNAAGVAQGSEFRVNTYTTSHQISPAVAMDAAGDFVVTWTSYGQDGSGYGVYAQRYNAAGGAPQGSEFQVNTTTTSFQDTPAVAMDAAGDFVVTWTSTGQDGPGLGIYAQRYAVNNYNAAFSTPVLSGQHTDTTAAPEGPAGTFSFDANFCNANNSAFPLTGLASQTVTLTNNNCLRNRNYGPAGTPSGTVLPCGAGSTLDFPATGDYSDYALPVGECVTVHYQIGLQQRKGFDFFVDVGGM